MQRLDPRTTGLSGSGPLLALGWMHRLLDSDGDCDGEASVMEKPLYSPPNVSTGKCIFFSFYSF